MAWVPIAMAAVAAAGKAATPVPQLPTGITSDPWGGFDNSGWTVATGSARASASRTEGAALSDVQRIAPWLVLGAVAIVVAKAWRAKKS